MSMIREMADPRHKAAARAIARALVLGPDETAWMVASAALDVHLTKSELALIAMAAFLGLPDEMQDEVIAIVSPKTETLPPHVIEAFKEYQRRHRIPAFLTGRRAA